MLDRLRVHVKGWLGVVILIMISIPFALFGLQNYTSGGSEQPVAEVGGFKIYQADVNRAYENRIAQLKEQYGDQYSPDLFSEEAVRQESLNRLVQDQLVLQTVIDDGYVASNTAILDVISKLDAFQKNGQFDKATYEQLLQARGLTTASFVDSVRSGIERDQFINSIVGTTLVDDSEINDFYRLTNQTRDIRYLLLPISSVIASVLATDEEINKNYTENEHLYKTPEEASIDYVELSLASLMLEVNPSDEELLAFYESEQQSFTLAGHRRASHILFEAPAGTAEIESEKKRAQAELALSRIKKGEDFASIAKELSDDIGSAKLGGDLGIITEGMMDAEFEKTLASLKEGEVSEVVQTLYGFQIIKLVSKEADKIQPYENVVNEVTELFKTNIAGEKFYQLAERFAELSFENPDTLTPLVDELELTIQQQTGVTQNNGEGVASYDKVRHAVFNEDVLAGNNSDVVEVDPEHLVVLRINQHTPEEVMPLAAVKNVIELSVKTDKANRLLTEKAADYLTKVKSGVSINELASLDEATLKDIGPVTRNDKSAPVKLLREAFSMSHPSDGKSSFKLSTLENGDVAIIELSKITDGDKAEITEASRESFKKFLSRLTGEVTLAASLANLSVDTDVVFANQPE
ncbi:MAG: SurA N-terminal domain-containing protein [Cycloclasticus sp.]|nr:SurA N-terminal domain-containing protein [Cycloclasticus sp.]